MKAFLLPVVAGLILGATGWLAAGHGLKVDSISPSPCPSRAPVAPAWLVVKAGEGQGPITLREWPDSRKLSDDGRARLASGRHRLLVEARGYLPATLDLMLRPGEQRTVTLEMVPRPPTRPEKSTTGSDPIQHQRQASPVVVRASLDTPAEYPKAATVRSRRRSRLPKAEPLQPPMAQTVSARPRPLWPRIAKPATVPSSERLGQRGVLPTYQAR